PTRPAWCTPRSGSWTWRSRRERTSRASAPASTMAGARTGRRLVRLARQRREPRDRGGPADERAGDLRRAEPHGGRVPVVDRREAEAEGRAQPGAPAPRAAAEGRLAPRRRPAPGA